MPRKEQLKNSIADLVVCFFSAAIPRQQAQNLRETNPAAAREKEENIQREIAMRGVDAVTARYQRLAENMRAAEELYASIPNCPRSVELLYQEICSSSLEDVRARYLRTSSGRHPNAIAWIAAAIVLVVIMFCLVLYCFH